MNNSFLYDVVAYWDMLGIERQSVSCGTQARDSELCTVLEQVGMPLQTWWLFRFDRAVQKAHDQTGALYRFGRVGPKGELWWREQEGICILIEGGSSSFANSSLEQFARSLVVFDKGCKRIQLECPGESDFEWEQGDVIIASMGKELRDLDARAFAERDSLWPCLLIDING